MVSVEAQWPNGSRPTSMFLGEKLMGAIEEVERLA